MGRQRLLRLIVACAVGVAGLLNVSTAWSQTRVIPGFSVSERYDSNVFFIAAGQRLEDYVTTLSPQVRVEHDGRMISGTGQMTITGEIFAINPGLNYVAINTSVNLGLDKLTAFVDKRWKLGVNEYITYTPQPPAFFTPAPGAGTTTGTAPENFIRGIQAVRANSLINVASVTTAYQVTPAVGVTSAVTNQYMRFGTTFAPAPGQGFFTTSFTNFSVGPEYKPTARDTLNANFNYSKITFSQADFSDGFELKGGTATWRRSWTQKWATTLMGGVTIFDQGGDLQYVASATVEYHGKHGDVSFAYSRSIFPSFFIAALPLLSEVYTLSGAYRFSSRLSGTLSLNYAENKSTPDPLIRFTSYGVTATLGYQLTKTTSISAAYIHNQFDTRFGADAFGFNRDAITVTYRIEWPDAFKNWMDRMERK